MNIKSSSSKLYSIQMLRAVAAIMVLSSHSIITAYGEYEQLSLSGTPVKKFYNFMGFASMGVDMFFVISGLIMVFISKDLFENKYAVKRFLPNRLVRIYPMYWIMLITYISLFLIQGLLLDRNEPFNIFYERVGGISFFLSSLILIPFEVNPEHFYPILAVGWTLVFEIFFYCSFCLVLRFPLRKALSILSIIFSLLSILFILNKADSIWLIFYSNPILLEFILGCWIGYLMIQRTFFSVKLLKIVLPITLISVFSTIFYDIPECYGLVSLNPFRLIFYGLPTALIVYCAVSIEFRGILKSSKILVALGNSSYSLYLAHAAFIIPITTVSWKKLMLYEYINSTGFGLFLIFNCIIIAHFLHIFVERPLYLTLKRIISVD